jgi:hypothetical protein
LFISRRQLKTLFIYSFGSLLACAPGYAASDVQAQIEILSALRLDQLKPETRKQIESTYLDSKSGLCAKSTSAPLTAQCNRIKRYFQIEDQFKKCGVPKNAAELVRFQDFRKSVLAGAGTRSAADIKNICHEFSSTQVDQAASNLSKVPKAIVSQQLVGLASEHALRNSARAFHAISAAFPGGADQKKFASYVKEVYGISGPNSSDGVDKNDESGALCGSNVSCRGEGAIILKQELRSAAKQGAPAPMDEATITKDLNARIDRMNRALSSVKAQVKVGKIWDSADEESAKASYAQYVEAYLREQDSPAGLLLSTQHLQKSTRIRLLSDLEKSKDSSSYQLPKHEALVNNAAGVSWIDRSYSPNPIKVTDIEAATLELKANIVVQTGLLSQMVERNNRSADHAEEDLARLVRTNPLAVGQTLMDFPEYAPFVCGMFGEIAQKEETDKRWKNYFIVGGTAALAIAGVASGGAAFAGYPVLAAIAGGTATAGGIALGSYQLGSAVNSNSQAQQGLWGYQAGNNLGKSQLEAARAFDEMKGELVSAGVSVIGLPAATKLIQSGGRAFAATSKGAATAAAATQTMSNISQAIRDFGGANAERMKKFFSRIKSVGGDEAEIIEGMANVPSATRTRFARVADGLDEKELKDLAGNMRSCRMMTASNHSRFDGAIFDLTLTLLPLSSTPAFAAPTGACEPRVVNIAIEAAEANKIQTAKDHYNRVVKANESWDKRVLHMAEARSKMGDARNFGDPHEAIEIIADKAPNRLAAMTEAMPIISNAHLSGAKVEVSIRKLVDSLSDRFLAGKPRAKETILNEMVEQLEKRASAVSRNPAGITDMQAWASYQDTQLAIDLCQMMTPKNDGTITLLTKRLNQFKAAAKEAGHDLEKMEKKAGPVLNRSGSERTELKGMDSKS